MPRRRIEALRTRPYRATAASSLVRKEIHDVIGSVERLPPAPDVEHHVVRCDPRDDIIDVCREGVGEPDTRTSKRRAHFLEDYETEVNHARSSGERVSRAASNASSSSAIAAGPITGSAIGTAPSVHAKATAEGELARAVANARQRPSRRRFAAVWKLRRASA